MNLKTDDKTLLMRKDIWEIQIIKNYKLPFYIIIVGFVFYCIMVYSIFFDLMLPYSYDNRLENIIEVRQGYNANQIADILYKAKLIKNKKVFILYTKIKALDSKLKAGKYVLSSDMSLQEIAECITEGNTISDTIRITIPEGLEIREIGLLLEEKGLGNKEKFIEATDSRNFTFKFSKYIPKNLSLEGYLFPDTYQVYKDIDEIGIIKIMLNRFEEIFNDELSSRSEETGLTVHEIITIASIIEREAKVDSERAIISSVFYNRLKNNMLLGSCVTVQYALGERKPNLTYKDLEIDSPYNTYKVQGLPPGPVSNPGEASIRAALYPAETNYYYFSANFDGTHTFSKTFSEHQKAINKN